MGLEPATSGLNQAKPCGVWPAKTELTVFPEKESANCSDNITLSGISSMILSFIYLRISTIYIVMINFFIKFLIFFLSIQIY